MSTGEQRFTLVRQKVGGVRMQPTWDLATVVRSESVGAGLQWLELKVPSIAAVATPGQFVMLNFPENSENRTLLPRPMAIHRRHRSRGTIEIYVKVRGAGTANLATVQATDSLLVTGPLGRGFEVSNDVSAALLIGRGIGVCSLMTVCEELGHRGTPTTLISSAREINASIGRGDCAELGVNFHSVLDTDGSSDTSRVRELVLAQVSSAPPSHIYVCGSQRLSALAFDLSELWGSRAQVSVEAHMACGLGYCHGCISPELPFETEEPPLVCVDGPVFDMVSSTPGREAVSRVFVS